MLGQQSGSAASARCLACLNKKGIRVPWDTSIHYTEAGDRKFLKSMSDTGDYPTQEYAIVTEVNPEAMGYITNLREGDKHWSRLSPAPLQPVDGQAAIPIGLFKLRFAVSCLHEAVWFMGGEWYQVFIVGTLQDDPVKGFVWAWVRVQDVKLPAGLMDCWGNSWRELFPILEGQTPQSLKEKMKNRPAPKDWLVADWECMSWTDETDQRRKEVGIKEGSQNWFQVMRDALDHMEKGSSGGVQGDRCGHRDEAMAQAFSTHLSRWRDFGLLDTGCSRAMAGIEHITAYPQTLSATELRMVQIRKSRMRFGFAGGAQKFSFANVTAPIPTLKCSMTIEVLNVPTPILISLKQMRKLKAKIDLEDLTMQVRTPARRHKVRLLDTGRGHMAMELSKNAIQTIETRRIIAEMKEKLAGFMKVLGKEEQAHAVFCDEVDTSEDAWYQEFLTMTQAPRWQGGTATTHLATRAERMESGGTDAVTGTKSTRKQEEVQKMVESEGTVAVTGTKPEVKRVESEGTVAVTGTKPDSQDSEPLGPTQVYLQTPEGFEVSPKEIEDEKAPWWIKMQNIKGLWKVHRGLWHPARGRMEMMVRGVLLFPPLLGTHFPSVRISYRFDTGFVPTIRHQ